MCSSPFGFGGSLELARLLSNQVVWEDACVADCRPKRGQRHTPEESRFSRTVVAEQQIEIRQVWFWDIEAGEVLLRVNEVDSHVAKRHEVSKPDAVEVHTQ